MQMASFPSFLSLTEDHPHIYESSLSHPAPTRHCLLSTEIITSLLHIKQFCVCSCACRRQRHCSSRPSTFFFVFSLFAPPHCPPPVCLSFSFLCRQDLSLAWNSVSVFIQLQRSACLCTITLRFWFWFLTLILGTQLMSAKHLINWAISLATQQALCMCIYVCTCKGNQNTALDIVLQALGSAS